MAVQIIEREREERETPATSTEVNTYISSQPTREQTCYANTFHKPYYFHVN